MMNEWLELLHETIAMAQCAEDAAEDPVKTVLGVVNGNLISLQRDIEYASQAEA